MDRSPEEPLFSGLGKTLGVPNLFREFLARGRKVQDKEGRKSLGNRLLIPEAIQDIVVPSLWSLEVANAVLATTRRQRIHKREWRDLFQILAKLPSEVDVLGFPQVTDEVLKIADRYQLSVYEAVYLELAQRRCFPLATLDRALQKAAQKAQVELLLG